MSPEVALPAVAGDTAQMIGRRRRLPAEDGPFVSVYRRTDGYYLIRNVQTTAGIWLTSSAEAVALPLDVGPAELGRSILATAGARRPCVPHPAQHEWAADRERRSAAILDRAKVKSWAAFERGSAQASVQLQHDLVTVTPLVPMPARSDSWVEDLERASRAKALDPEAIGVLTLNALMSID